MNSRMKYITKYSNKLGMTTGKEDQDIILTEFNFKKLLPRAWTEKQN